VLIPSALVLWLYQPKTNSQSGSGLKCEETHRRNRAIARFDFPVIECGGSFTKRPPLVDASCFQTYPRNALGAGFLLLQ
jgi:hypothetical protein